MIAKAWPTIVAVLGLLVFLAALPRLLSFVKSSTKGHTGAAAMMIGMAFSALLDPAKKASAIEIDKQKQRGRAQSSKASELEDR